ncbi:MAG: cation diffusion facilitator family transporter [Alphaproteobacteria bacterium]|nr:cation diffusion facilitator family transporter [Alphaproteobacteria bacterium]MBV8412394.1 cation diffusion facilitator family transporter [Alphaproteobacteria bacterium]
MARSRSQGNAATSKRVVHVALAGNVLVAVTKFVAAGLSGSASMLSEGVHSAIDCSNELLLLYGYRRASRPPDPVHPFGYGREIYFWSFVVALLLLTLGAGLSIYEGVRQIRQPQSLSDLTVSYIVLAASAVFEGASWLTALRAFRAKKGDCSYWEAVRESKDPPSFMVLFEDSAALIGLVIAAAGITAADRFAMPILDGVASVMIGVLLGVAALLLVRETKELLIGERASPRINDSLVALAREQPGIEDANGAVTVQLAPDQIVATLSLEFEDELHTPQIEQSVQSLEHRIRERHPEVVALFVKPQTRRTFEQALARGGIRKAR